MPKKETLTRHITIKLTPEQYDLFTKDARARGFRAVSTAGRETWANGIGGVSHAAQLILSQQLRFEWYQRQIYLAQLRDELTEAKEVELWAESHRLRPHLLAEFMVEAGQEYRTRLLRGDIFGSGPAYEEIDGDDDDEEPLAE